MWSKTLMELLFNPCGELWWSPEGPVSQIHFSHLHAGIFSHLLRTVLMLKGERGAESNGKLPHLFIPRKTAALVVEFAVEDLLTAELQPWFLRLQWSTCPRAEHTDDDFSVSLRKSRKPCLIYVKIVLMKCTFSQELLIVIIITIIRVFCPRAGLLLQTQEPRFHFCPKAGLPLQIQELMLQF